MTDFSKMPLLYALSDAEIRNWPRWDNDDDTLIYFPNGLTYRFTPIDPDADWTAAVFFENGKWYFLNDLDCGASDAYDTLEAIYANLSEPDPIEYPDSDDAKIAELHESIAADPNWIRKITGQD
jgi:hypothetical protein